MSETASDGAIAEPLRFTPIYKHLIWGGRRFASVLGRSLGPEPNYAESWELADHAHGLSQVAEGPLQDRTIQDLLRTHFQDLLGTKTSSVEQFPLLIKFLDAHQILSVQVHPDDLMGQKLCGDNGKTEAWVILHADPGSLIYAGLKTGVTRLDLQRAMAGQGEPVEALLHRFEPRVGDAILIPAGTIHAIGAGIVLAEVQQMSNATFRIDDWGRLGADGHPRTLHRDEALEVTDFQRGPVNPVIPIEHPLGSDTGCRESLIHCPYFAIDRLSLDGPVDLGHDDRFTILIGLEGSATLRWSQGSQGQAAIGRGQTWLVPASLGTIEVIPHGSVQLLESWVP